MADLTKSVPQITEQLVTGLTTNIRPTGVSALLSLAAVPVKGLYVITATVDLASVGAATSATQEFIITDSSHTVRVGVGDLFIPFAWSTLNAGLLVGPAAAVTADKAAVKVINATAGALDAASATVSFLWIKTA